MANVFEFIAEARSASGSSASKAVRRQGKVPAVLYGGNGMPEMLAFDHNEIVKHLVHEAVYSHVLDIKIDGRTEKAILKHIQRHPAKSHRLCVSVPSFVGGVRCTAECGAAGAHCRAAKARSGSRGGTAVGRNGAPGAHPPSTGATFRR